MKAIKITYWITTVIVAFMMAFSAFSYLTKPEMKQAFQHLGFPDYFRIELAVAKFIGAIVLLIPVAARVKEWAYAGFAIVFVSAFIAHSSSGDPVNYQIMPIIFLVIMLVSYICNYKIKTGIAG